MATRKHTGSRVYHYGRLGSPPPDQGDLGYALRWFFGSREEMNEIFRELEAKMVEDMHRIAEEAKRARDAEWPLPREGDLPIADRPVQPAVKGK